jgi:hypothetical protein
VATTEINLPAIAELGWNNRPLADVAELIDATFPLLCRKIALRTNSNACPPIAPYG